MKLKVTELSNYLRGKGTKPLSGGNYVALVPGEGTPEVVSGCLVIPSGLANVTILGIDGDNLCVISG